MLDALGVARAGQNRAHYEGAEGKREAAENREYGHAQTESHRNHQEGLLVEKPAEPVEGRRKHEHSHQKPYDEEECQFADAHKHLPSLHALVDGNRRQHHHHHHGKEVLDDKNGENQRGELLLPEPQIGERLDYYRGRRHAQHATQKERVDVGESQQMADNESCGHHPGHNHHGGDNGRPARVQQLLETELQPERKEQHDNAYLGPELNVGFGGDRGERGEVRAGQKPGHNVAEHHRLLYPFEKQRYDGAEQQNESEVGNQAVDAVHMWNQL